MSKELFNQALETTDFADSDRIATGQPSVAGGKNMLWSKVKEIMRSAWDWLDFTPQSSAPTHQEGRMFYDSVSKSFKLYNDISDVSLDIGEETWARFINKSGATLENGKCVYITGVFGNDLTFDLAIASDKNQSIRTLGLVTNNTPNDAHGYVTRYGNVHDVDTSMWPENTVLFLSPDTPGELTGVRPSAPNYIVNVGIVIVSDATHGVIGVDVSAFTGTDTTVNIENILNGIVTETPKVALNTDTIGTIYVDVTNEYSPTENLPFLIGGTTYFLDTTTGNGTGGAARIEIPAGASSTETKTSFVYIYLDSGVPTLASSTNDPNVPYAMIAYISVFDYARTAADGQFFAYRRHNNVIDRLDGTHDGAFGLSVETINSIRLKLGSNWISGQDATPTVDNSNIKIALSAGIGSQFRKSNLPAFDGNSYLIYNDNSDQVTYQNSTNLTDITEDANGNSLLSNNTFYTIRIFYQLNSDGIGNYVIATRPRGSYSTLQEAISDPNNYTTNTNDTYTEEIVYALYDMVISRTGGGGATISLGQLTDLRTKLAGGVGGGGASGGGGTDDKVRVSANDTINSYLDDKVQVSGALKTILNPSGNEILDFKIYELYTPDGTSGVLYTDNSGNVGINNINPNNKLKIYYTGISGLPNAINNDTSAYNADNVAGIQLKSSNNSLFIGVDDTSNSRQVWVQSGHENKAYAASTGKILLNPLGGKVGINTTSPSEQLEVGGNVKADDFILSSDKRLKDEINYNVPTIDGLKPVSYKMGGSLKYGFIAQDMLETHPELVIGTGREENGVIDYYSIKQNSIIALLVNEVQELKQKNIELETRLAKLEKLLL